MQEKNGSYKSTRFVQLIGKNQRFIQDVKHDQTLFHMNLDPYESFYSLSHTERGALRVRPFIVIVML